MRHKFIRTEEFRPVNITTLRQKYGMRLYSIEGAIGVLEEMVIENIKNKNEDEKNVLNNDNFNSLYESILRYINYDEELHGFSEYRKMLDKVDEKLDKLTFSEREEIKKIDKEKSQNSVGPHHVLFDKPIIPLPANFHFSEVRVI